MQYTYVVRRTFVKRQPFADFIVIMHPEDMKELGIKDNDYIKIGNVISKGEEKKEIKITTLVINSEHKLSKMTSLDKASCLKEGEIGIDQTYREALALKKEDKITISKTNKRYGLKERFLSFLNYQKAIVRIQANAPYMENELPVVCLCEEMMTTIGASYGDRIKIESVNNSKIKTKAAKLTTSMQDFHDFVLDNSNEEKVKPRLTANYFLNPSDFDIHSENLQIGDLIHPIFMDAIAMHLLDVDRLHPIKIRRSLWWDVQKKLNSFGSVALIAFSITFSLYMSDPSSPLALLIWSIILGA